MNTLTEFLSPGFSERQERKRDRPGFSFVILSAAKNLNEPLTEFLSPGSSERQGGSVGRLGFLFVILSAAKNLLHKGHSEHGEESDETKFVVLNEV